MKQMATGERLLTIRFAKVLGGLAILSLSVNFAAQWRQEHAVQFSSEATRVSLALQQGHGFSDPFLTGPSGPTAQMAPLYPFLHAGICALFGTRALGWSMVLAVTALTWAFQWAYAYRLAAAFGQPLPGFIAAVIGVLVPLPGRFYKWEAVFTGAALAYCTWTMTQLLAGKRGKWLVARLGAGLAAAVMICPSTILIWPGWAALTFLKMGRARAMRVLVPVFLLSLIPVSLWTVRNYLVFGRLFLIRDDIGMVLVSSYDDCASALISENISSGCFAHEHPSGSPAMLQKLNAVGEIKFSAAEMRRTLAWVSSHPGRSARLTLEHIFYFWFPLDRVDTPTFLYGVLMSGLTVIGFGAILWKSEAIVLLLSVLVPFSIAYYPTQFEQRYRYPVLWISALLASVGITFLVPWIGLKVRNMQR